MGDGKGVSEAVGGGTVVGMRVTVGDAVTRNVEVAVGGTVVALGNSVFVDVGVLGKIVTPGTGVRVGTFGTQSS